MAKYKHFTEKDLYAAARLSRYKDLTMVPPKSELKGYHTFSEEFERKIAEIYKLFNEPKKKSKTVNRVLLIAAIITILFAMLMSVSAISDCVYELFFSHEKDNTNGIFIAIQKEDGSYIEARGDMSILFYPSYIPDGFEEIGCFTDDITYRRIIYTNEKGETIIFNQEIIFTYLGVDTENTDISEVTEGGITYYCSQKGNFSSVVWSQNGYAFNLICEHSMSEAIQIAKSLLVQ